MDTTSVKNLVQNSYSIIARQGKGCGCGCGDPVEQSLNLGYSKEELHLIPPQANLGLGCGNPTAIASIKPGEIVLDLGSGAGMDCFLAAAQVGENGQVIGVDMTPEMIDKARANAVEAGVNNIEFRQGDIENLPVADQSVDVVISNCVINLVPDKQRAFQEIFRVLRPGGRVMITDIALDGSLPAPLLASAEAYVGCIAGATQIDHYLQILKTCGFFQPRIEKNSINLIGDWLVAPSTAEQLDEWGLSRDDAVAAARAIVSVRIQATRPAADG